MSRVNDWVRSLFGNGTTTQQPRSNSKSDHTQMADDDYDNLHNWPAGHPDGQSPDQDFPFHHSDEANDMFRHFDGMFRDFDEMYRTMGITDFPTVQPGVPGIEEGPPSDWGSWRDLLKRPPSSHLETDPDQDKATPGRMRPPPYFGLPRGWIPHYGSIESKVDRDLDEEFKKGDISKLIVPMDELEKEQPHQNIRSLSVHTSRGADGRVEERRTVLDAQGNQETTVTRKIGDQSQTVTTRGSPDGSEELSETTVNLDNKDKENFERRWNMASLPESHRSAAAGSVVPGHAPLDTKKSSIFTNLFGSSFPGFPASSKKPGSSPD